MRANLRDVFEQLDRLADRHVEHVGDRVAVEQHGERLGVVALAAAIVALDPHVGQEVHLDSQLAVPFALLAASAGHVEAEPPRRVAAQLRLGQVREQLANLIEHAGVGRRVRRRRLAERHLIDADHLVDLLDAAERRRACRGTCEPDAACGPSCCRARLRRANSCREPLTPVTTVNVPSGMSTVTLRRLLCVAPTIESNSAVEGRNAESP